MPQKKDRGINDSFTKKLSILENHIRTIEECKDLDFFFHGINFFIVRREKENADKTTKKT
jgi:hypothetical protein